MTDEEKAYESVGPEGPNPKPPRPASVIEAVKAIGKPLVVVLMNGSGINWANQNAKLFWKLGIRAKRAAQPLLKPWPASTIPPDACPSPSIKV